MLAALAGVGGGLLAGCTATEEGIGAWRRPGYDRRNSGVVPDRDGPSLPLTLRWTARVPDGHHHTSPVFANGTVSLGYRRETKSGEAVGVRTLDADDGSTVSDTTVAIHEGEASGSALFWDSLVIADGALYLVTFDGAYSLTTDGEQRWHLPMEGGPANSIQAIAHPVVADGRAFVPTASTTSDTAGREALYAVDDSTGEVDWRYVPPAAEFGWTFPPASADGTVYLAALEYGVVALDAASGTVEWTAEIPANGPPTVANGRLFVSTEAEQRSSIVALSLSNGEEVWRSTGDGTRLGRRLAAAHGRVYHRESLADVVARDQATGKERWRNTEYGHVYGGAPAVTDDTLYVTVTPGSDAENRLAMLDPATGTLRGAAGVPGGGHLNASIALGEDVAIVTSSYGGVYAVETCPDEVCGPPGGP